MSEYPTIWEEILHRLGLQSFDGIQNIKDVLHFMGYTTLQSIAKLRKPKELSAFQIEVSKLSTNSRFCEKFPQLQNWHLGPGTIEILKDISNAASSCMSYNNDNVESIEETVKEELMRRCIKVTPNLLPQNVMVDLNEKPICEIICPFDSCKDVSKLSLIKQANPFARPKFNTWNFERHINTQHLNKKRKRNEDATIGNDINKKSKSEANEFVKNADQEPIDSGNSKNEKGATVNDKTVLESTDCDISRNESQTKTIDMFHLAPSSTPVKQISAGDSFLTPKTASISQLKKDLALANEQIIELKGSFPAEVATTSPSNICMTPKTVKIEKLLNDLSIAEKISEKLQEENISLRHRCMNMSGRIRTICRIKPGTSDDCFDWRRSSDGTKIQIGK